MNYKSHYPSIICGAILLGCLCLAGDCYAGAYIYRPGNAASGSDLPFTLYGESSPAIVPFTSESAAGVNPYSGGWGVYSASWVGGAVAVAGVGVEFHVDVPSSVEVTFDMINMGGAINYGFASFSGTTWYWKLNEGDPHHHDIDDPFSYAVIADKIISLILLAAGGLAPEGEIAETIEYIDLMYSYISLLQNLESAIQAGDATVRSESFHFTVDPGDHQLMVGVSATTSALLTGSSFAILSGQTTNITLNIHAKQGVKADLTIGGIILTNETVVTHTSTPFFIERCNLGGTATLEENYALILFDPSGSWSYLFPETNRFDRNEFRPDSTRTDCIWHTFTQKGRYRLLAWADNADVIPEFDDYGNNYREKYINVKGSKPRQPNRPSLSGNNIFVGIHLQRNKTYTFVTGASDPDHDTNYYCFELQPFGDTNWQVLTNLLICPGNQWCSSSNIQFTPVLSDPDLLPGTNSDPRTWLTLSTNVYYNLRSRAADSDGEADLPSTNLTFAVDMNQLPITPVISGVLTSSTLAGVSIIATSSDINSDRMAFRFDWGENTNNPVWTDWYWCPTGQTSMTLTHIYTNAGLYLVKAQATDLFAFKQASPPAMSGVGSVFAYIYVYRPGTNALVVRTVDTNLGAGLPNAGFTVSGASNFTAQTDLTGYFSTPAYPGTYTVTFDAVAGYVTPTAQTLTLSTNGSIVFSGAYRHATGNLLVKCNIVGQGEIYGFGAAGGTNYTFNSASWSMPNAWAGDYWIFYKPSDEANYGLPVPRSETKTLATSNSLQFLGRYIKRPVASFNFTYSTNSHAYYPSNAFALVDEEAVQFDATGSYSPAQPRGAGPPYDFPELSLPIEAYQFAFDDGWFSGEGTNFAGPGTWWASDKLFDGKTKHVFHKTGLRHATLTVLDSTGCSNRVLATQEIQVKARPVAHIDLEPSPAIAGEIINFNGWGADGDAGDHIIDYEWTLDGTVVSTNQSFWTNRLAAGNHGVSLRVHANDNVWSHPGSVSLDILPPKQWLAFKNDPTRLSHQSSYPGRENGKLDYALQTWLMWPFTADSPLEGSPVAANLNGDWSSGLQIVFVSRSGTLYAKYNTGTTAWTRAVGASSGTPAIGDLDMDDHPEVVAGSQNGVFAFDRNGSLQFRYAYPAFEYSIPVIEDIDPSVPGREIAVTADDGTVHLIYADGTCGTNQWPFTPGTLNQPRVLRATRQPSLTNIIVQFSKPMSLPTVLNTNNYTVCLKNNPGWCLPVYSVSNLNNTPALTNQPTTVMLVTGDPRNPPFDTNSTFQLTVTGAQDTNNTPISPNPTSLDIVPYGSAGQHFFSSAPAVANIDSGNDCLEVVAGSTNGTLYVLDCRGNMLASFTIPGGAAIRTTPAIADVSPNVPGQEILFGADDGFLYCLNYTNGSLTLLWQYTDTTAPGGKCGPIRSSPAIGFVGEYPFPQAVFGCDKGDVHVLLATNGACIGTYNCGPGVMVRSTPAIANIDTTHNVRPDLGDLPEVIFGATDGSLYAVSFSYGARLVWRFPLSALPIFSSPAVADIDHDPDLEILVGANDNRFYVLKAIANPALVPLADFAPSQVAGLRPLTAAFTDTSAQTPTSWKWDFGDGTTSTAQNPTHVYNVPGAYTVALTAKNAHGSNTMTKTNCVTVYPVPVADFSASPVMGQAPLSVQLTDQSLYSPTAWYWTFGDGQSSTQENPAHTYLVPGVYTVSLTASNLLGSDKAVRTNYIEVLAVSPVANFTQDATTGYAPLTVRFTDTSANSPICWNWDFGDGTSGLQQHPTHTYQTNGHYLVSLTVSNTAGADTKVSSAYVQVATAPLLPPGPILELHLDEGTGEIAHDATTNHNDGMVYFGTFGATWTANGYAGKALYFDGNDNEAVLFSQSPSLNITNTFWVEAWIKVPPVSYNYLAIMDKLYCVGGPSYGFTVYLNGGVLRFSIYSGDKGNADLWAGPDLRDNRWHHVAASWDGSYMRGYVDGGKFAERPWTNAPASSPQVLCIGQRWGGWGGTMPFIGALDEVRILRDPPPPSAVSAAFVTTNVVISWIGFGALESATNVSGPYNTVTNATCPYSVRPTPSQMFYRLRVP